MFVLVFAISIVTMRSPYDARAYRLARRRLRGLPCVFCSKPSDTVDHRVSLVEWNYADGDPNQPSNLQPACKSCNSKKGVATRNRRRRKRERNRSYI